MTTSQSGLKPLTFPIRLSPQPQTPPRYSLNVQRKDGSSLTCADPKYTRVLLALMDMQAVMGGAACHWGGPSAFAELMSALYGLVLERSHKQSQPWYEI